MTRSKLLLSTPVSCSLFRRLGSSAAVSCLAVALASTTGCGDDDTTPPNPGAGGSAGHPSGGKGGKASAGKGGAGATSGLGGGSTSAGRAGKGSGGSAADGDAGAATGTGGSGARPARGGSGGTGGTALPNAGRGPEAGSGGESGEGLAGTGGGEGNAGGADNAGATNGGENSGGGGQAGDGSAAVITRITPVSSTGPDRFYGVTFGADGSIFAVGQIAISNDSNADFALLLAKFTPGGVLDPSFGAGGVVVRNVVSGTNGELYRGVVVQSTGKIVVSGSMEHAGATDARDRDIAVLRFNADGTKDTTFGTDGVVALDLSTGVSNGSSFLADSAWGLARYADDRLVVSGGQVRSGATDTDFALVRLNADGTRDTSFGTNGVFSLDTQFSGSNDNASPRNLTILPGTDGIIGAGYRPVPGADTAPVLYKVSDAGVLDTTFGTNGVFSQSLLTEQTECYQAVVQPKVGGGYNLVTTGYGRELSTETTDLVSLRVSSDGVLDTTYGNNGLVRIDVGGFGDNSRRLLVLPDRRIVLVGGGRLTSSDVDGVVGVLTPDGQPDTSFGANGLRLFNLGGPADFLWSVALSPDQTKLAIAGIKGVGNSPTPPSANDDTALLLLPLPE